MDSLFRIILIFTLVCLFTACKTSEFTGFSYDPEGGNVTTDKPVIPQHKRTIGFLSDGVWISNEFTGARISDAYRIGKNHYRIVVAPENAPINNSPWYGFKVWSEKKTEVEIELYYPEGRHRYVPKISKDRGNTWTLISPEAFKADTVAQTGRLTLEAGPDTTWVSAQEMETTDDFENWLSGIRQKPYVSSRTIGYSHQGRPLKLVKISAHSEQNPKGVILIYGRQHPPEVPGYLASLKFIEALAADTKTAQTFRNYFDVWAVPLMNPDGADNGYWRHNSGGVDLNRDWNAFNQPETKAVRDALLPLQNRSGKKVFYAIDFHSTDENIFYPINRDIATFPQHFTYEWYDEITGSMNHLPINLESFDTSAPIAKNWTWHTFGVDAVTFEVNDGLDREVLDEFARNSAGIFMKKMISVYENEYLKADPVASDGME